jgi:integrase
MLFDQAVYEYLEAKQPRLRETTMAGYVSAIECHLLPKWAGREIEDVAHEELQKWVDSFDLPGAAEKAFKTFRQIYRWTLRKHQLRVWDATQGVELPAKPRHDVKAASAKQLKSVLTGIRGEAWEAVVVCQAALGLRRSEACALKWGDVNLSTGEARIDKGAHRIGGRTVVTPTKTPKSTRTLVLPRWAVARLRELKRAKRPSKADGLCSLAPDAISRRFRSWCRSHGFDLTMMRLRHTFASLSLAAGVPLEVVAMEMGHSTTEMCYSRYLASSTAVFRKAQRTFEDALLSA